MTGKRDEQAADKTLTNRERADRRRAVQRTLRSERERLTSMTGTRPAFDHELLLTFARNRLSAALALPILVVIVAAAALLGIRPLVVFAWAVAMLAVHMAALVVCGRFVRIPARDISVRLWRARFVAMEFVGALAWATVLILPAVAPGMASEVEVFRFTTALIVVSVATTLASAIPAAAVAGTVPVTATLATVYLGRGEFLFFALALMAVGAQVFFLVLASRLYSATLSMIESRAEKDLLIAELETAKAVSDDSRRRAEEANLAKSRFLATMSHELRTPLNAILGFSEVMKSEVLGPMANPAYREYAADIHTSGQHLLDLINEILDLSRIEAGRYELYEEPVNLVAIVEECRHLLQLRAHNKAIAFTEHYTRALPRLWADDRAVRQIVLNLLSNAIKFTPTGGEIWIRVGWADGGGQFVSIRDNGPGIPEEEIPIVLSSFGQGSLAIKSAEQGAGLGLPIVQALARMHDAGFDLKSKLREGTEITVTFPHARVMEALPPIAETGSRGWRRTG
ncbi:MAG TPA: ATP-binding protein [Bauldia sp.]|nr:ATP-binding protein [Bauldia sp.]